jgi:hypothetical protein
MSAVSQEQPKSGHAVMSELGVRRDKAASRYSGNFFNVQPCQHTLSVPQG